MESSGTIDEFKCAGEAESSGKPEVDGADDRPAWSISCRDLRAAKETWQMNTTLRTLNNLVYKCESQDIMDNLL